MIGKRAFLKAIMGAPVAAVAASQTAMSEGSLGMVNQVGVGPQMSEASPFERAVRDQFFRKKKLDEIRRNASLKENWPVEIASKKSWSPAFKAHQAQSKLLHTDMFDVWSNAPEGDHLTYMVRVLKGAGITVEDLGE